MPKPLPTRHIFLRAIVLVVSALAATLLVEPGEMPTTLLAVLSVQGLAWTVAAGLRSGHHTPGARLVFLAIDLLAIGATGFLTLQTAGAPGIQVLPFLSAMVVGILVACMGNRPAAGVLGALAGWMVLGMGTLFLDRPGLLAAKDVVIPQGIWVGLAAWTTAVMSGWVHQQAAWMRLSKDVAKELRAREAEASEMVSLSQSLSDSANLEELAEAVLRHLRCHLAVRARGILLESDSTEIALWEEQGRLTADGVERRRVLVQKGLQRAGSSYAVRNLTGRSLGGGNLPDQLDFHTVVDVPVRVGGRVAGVVVLADPARSAISPDRIGMLADVARRLGEALHRIERRRVGENRRTSMLLREMRDGVMLLGTDGSVQIANPAARGVLARCVQEGAPGQLGEMSLEDLGRTPPGIVRRFRFRVPGAGDEPDREYACTGVGVLDAGKRVGTLVTVSDVSEEELARRQLMRAEKTTLVGQTLAGVAHELNNPLAALIGYADILKSQDVPEKIERAVTRMCEQAVRASKIVRNLLNFARRKNPQRVPVPVKELTEGVFELFAYEARIGGVELQLDVPDGTPPILADRHAIQQILVNLVQNALHALQGWEGERRITLSARAKDEEIVISVRDSGPGIPEDLRARIFQAFFTTKGAKNGTGLGLALSASIARDHGGELVLEPDAGTGACFVIRLPLHAVSESLEEPTAGADAPELPRHVLVVDDEPSVRETLVAQLGNLGSRVDSAANSTEAERMLRDGRYDAILLDVRMPGTSGIELHRSLSERQPNLAGRVVFMTGDFVNDDVLNTVGRTGNLLLEKPFSIDELKAALSRAPAMQETSPGFSETA